MLRPDVEQDASLHRYEFDRPYYRRLGPLGFRWVPPHIMRHTFGSLLARLVGHDVRLAGRAFASGVLTAGRPLRFLQVADLILPNGSQPGAVPVVFDGRLREFERRIGVVVVSLDVPSPAVIPPRRAASSSADKLRSSFMVPPSSSWRRRFK